MASRLNPYITFRDNARGAMEFYHDVFGGELAISTFGEYGAEENPEGTMHALLETPAGFTIMASDAPPGVPHGDSSSIISVSLSGDDEGELRGYWEKLAAGGQVTMPLEKQVWGDTFGMCVDQFGIAWMVNIAGGQA